MSASKNAVLTTALILGNLTISLHASELREPQARSVIGKDKCAASHISNLLEARGLEPDAAETKVQNLFAQTVTVQDIQALSSRLGDNPSVEQLESTLVMRALFEKPVDFTSVQNLVGLVQEASGKAPSRTQLTTLHEFATTHSTRQSIQS